MKTTIYILIAALVIIGGFFALNAYIYNEKQMQDQSLEQLMDQPVEQASGMIAVSGSVTEVNLDQIAFDGPSLVTLVADDGQSYTIAIPSFGINMCVASDQIVDVQTLSSGDRIEAQGELDSEGYIVPCGDTAHYLRAL